MVNSIDILEELRAIRTELKTLSHVSGDVPMTLDEAADFVKTSTQNFRKLVAVGRIRGQKNGKRWLFYTSDLNEWLRGRGVE